MVGFLVCVQCIVLLVFFLLSGPDLVVWVGMTWGDSPCVVAEDDGTE